MISNYKYTNSELNESHKFLLPTVTDLLNGFGTRLCEKKFFELGCGNGSVGNFFSDLGWAVTGIDASSDGIKLANAKYPHLNLRAGSVYDELELIYGRFPIILSLEVIEHLYAPRDFCKSAYNLLEEDGVLILSTPYHGYLKNLALAITGLMDKHFTALWDGGHIKFWSVKTITALLNESGFSVESVFKVGRIKPIAKSMIIVARKNNCV